MSVTAETARVSVVPSPQPTVKLVIAPGVLLTEKFTVTVAPSLAGFGRRVLMVTTGAPPGLTVSDVLAEFVSPAASVAFTVMVKDPVVEYAWVCGLAPQTLKLSPKLTQVLEIASSSVAVKLTDTV